MTALGHFGEYHLRIRGVFQHGGSNAIPRSLVEEFVSQASVEAFDDDVLHRLAWRDVVPFDAGVIRLCQNGVWEIRGSARPSIVQAICSASEFHHDYQIAAIHYRSIRDRIQAEDPQIDEQTLAETVEGLTDLHEVLTAVIRAALADEAVATGLKGRVAEMEDRLTRLQDRAYKRRQIAKEVMVELDLKALTAPDFTASIRPGTPALMVIDESAVPGTSGS